MIASCVHGNISLLNRIRHPSPHIKIQKNSLIPVSGRCKHISDSRKPTMSSWKTDNEPVETIFYHSQALRYLIHDSSSLKIGEAPRNLSQSNSWF